MLYPLKFKPRLVAGATGGRRLESLGKPLPADGPVSRSLELYDVPAGDGGGARRSSEVSEGPLAGRMLHELIGEFGRAILGDVRPAARGAFPVSATLLDVSQPAPLRVHSAEAALYIVQAEPGARIGAGLKPGVTREALERAVADGSAGSVLKVHAAREGRCLFLRPGEVHLIGPGIVAAEITSAAARTMEIDMAHPEAVAEAMELVNFGPEPEPPQPRAHVAGLFTTVTRMAACEAFKLEKVRFVEGVEEAVPYDEPVVWLVLEGDAEVRVGGMKTPVRFTRGDTLLLPAEMKEPVIRTLADCTWLEVTFPTKPEVE